MKRYLLSLSLILITFISFGQNGLEKIIVEKYYISDANDALANADGGVLPVGSITYRIYVDMLPGYIFQAAYGIPGHELRIETSTLFFNNEDRGNTSPSYSKSQAANNTVMLDSWLSVGAACSGNIGVLKTDDDGVNTVVNTYSPMVLQNTDAIAGIPISVQDGMVAGTPKSVTAVGIGTEIEVFNNQNDGTNGPLFSTTNGSWASLNGSTGADPDSNRVLIAQITTDGILSFKLNIQLRTPTNGTENYVAENPTGIEIQIPSLTYPEITAINDYEKSNADFIVFPNPTCNYVNLVIPPTIKESNTNFYTVSDISGRVLLIKNLNAISVKSIEQLDLSSFDSGIYMISLSLNGIVSTKKVIKN